MAIFCTPAFSAAVRGSRRNRPIAMTFGLEKLEWRGYPTVKKFDMFSHCDTLLTCDWRTNRRTSCDSAVCAMHTHDTHRAVKINTEPSGVILSRQLRCCYVKLIRSSTCAVWRHICRAADSRSARLKFEASWAICRHDECRACSSRDSTWERHCRLAKHTARGHLGLSHCGVLCSALCVWSRSSSDWCIAESRTCLCVRQPMSRFPASWCFFRPRANQSCRGGRAAVMAML